MSALFRLGLIINPLAGLGGAVGLKGSDGVAEQALALGAVPQAGKRTEQALTPLVAFQDALVIKTAAGEMGQTLAEAMGFQTNVCYQPQQFPTTAEDTEAAVQALLEAGVDLVLFAGGDGTARNICQVLPDHISALGIPAGCKIHSGVYAISPTAAGKLVASLVAGELVSIKHADVMDIDEQAFRDGVVKARRFGELQIPAALQYVQRVKMGGRESEELVLDDLAAWVVSQMDDDVRYVMGSGSTVAAVMAELGLDNTLLGVDVVENGELIAKDVTASQLHALVHDYPSRLIITLIGGQGHVFGRGNQQLSPAVIRAIGRDHIWLIATKTKLQQLAGRPLLADSGDPELDSELQGLLPVLTGYNDYVMYRLGEQESE